ncbi:hypothetical protein G0Q06_12985 [Puniceicoccales bacterium CK1056]|uniref:Uncharacterized protein n=1 Tax=Oceanipulchritudo coccoides TaxID=2706888 RepID=A0A6B2M3N9_9BACT|nr:hypothetical protein [Oceanipulchritudo coccoides]NDV63373.1 hypothetical protein [Oceanipulchritudo coccoides]
MNEKRSVDQFARDVAITKYGLPPSLHVPIAAREVQDIITYIGSARKILSSGPPIRALFIEPYLIPQKDSLPIWELEESAILHHDRQVWVHVDYSGYRRSYLNGLGEKLDKGFVLDHVMNRRVARLKGFSYLRIVPISREANSSSGGLCEKWAVEYHSSSHMRQVNKDSPARIQYADLSDLVKMLNLKTGGSLQDPVNEAQYLVEERPSTSWPKR